MRQLIYVDHAATTPCLPAVVSLMQQIESESWANPSSMHYQAGRRARGLIDTARTQVANAIGAPESSITFTSGATEACNTCVFGAVGRLLPQRQRILMLATEHPAMQAAAQRCADAGAEVITIPVHTDGTVDCDAYRAALQEPCALVIAMLVNNETGVIQPIQELTEQAHAHGALLCCDASQALGRIPIDVSVLGIDFLILSGHKCYGPKGSGAFYKRPGLAIDPLIHGGGQERNLRSGTENTAAIAGFGLAAATAKHEITERATHLSNLHISFEQELIRQIPTLTIHGQEATRAPGFTFVSHAGLSQKILPQLSGVCASAGSSCASSSSTASKVLIAMGTEEKQAAGAVRVTAGISTTNDDMLLIAEKISNAVHKLKK